MAEGAGAGALKGVASGASTGAAIGSLFGPAGTLIGAGTGALVGGVAGGIAGHKKGKIEKEKRALISGREKQLSDWFGTEYNRNILDTDYGKAMTTQLENRVRDSDKQLASTSAITGASDEAAMAGKAKMQENISDVYGNIAAQGQSRKDSVRHEYVSRQGGYDNATLGMMTAQQQSLDNAMGNLGSAGNNAANAYAMGAFNEGGVSDWWKGRQADKAVTKGTMTTKTGGVGL